MDDRLFLFIYAKDGRVKVLTYPDAKAEQAALFAAGYKHTATITAREWIEHILNDARYEGPNISEARGIPTNTIDHGQEA